METKKMKAIKAADEIIKKLYSSPCPPLIDETIFREKFGATLIKTLSKKTMPTPKETKIHMEMMICVSSAIFQCISNKIKHQ